MWSLFFLSLGIALFCSFFCSLCEAALLSLTPGQIEGMAQKSPRRARIWRNYRARIDTPISAILILNTSAHTIGATVAGSQFAQLCGNDSFFLTLFSIGFTYMMLQFTEILPKNLGVRFNTKIAYLVTVPLGIMIQIFRPVIWFVHFMNRPFETKDAPPVSPLEELSALVKMGKSVNLLDTLQVSIMEKGANMRERTAQDVMVPAEQISFLSLDQTPAEAMEVILADPHTRFPLIEHANPNSVLGYVNVKELITLPKSEKNQIRLHALRRDVQFVKEATSLSQLLKLFVRDRAHMLIVQGPDLRTLGLITVEDILEDLLGDDLKDEFDSQLPTHAIRSGYGIYSFGGGVPMTAVFEDLKLEPELEESEPKSESGRKTFPPSVEQGDEDLAETLAETVVAGRRADSSAASETLSDWLLRRLNSVPTQNQKVTLEEWTFIIRRVRRDQIFDVLAMKSVQK